MAGNIRHEDYDYTKGGYVTSLKVDTEEVGDDATDVPPRDELHVNIETPDLAENRTLVVHLGNDTIFRGHPDQAESPAVLLDYLSALWVSGDVESQAFVGRALDSWYNKERNEYANV